MRLDINFKENNKMFNGSFGELEVINHRLDDLEDKQ